MVLRRLNMVLSRKDIFHILDIWGGEPVIKINGINDRRHAKRRLVVDRKKERTNLLQSSRLRKLLVRYEKVIESNFTLEEVFRRCIVSTRG
jgi:hypothetical protein